MTGIDNGKTLRVPLGNGVELQLPKDQVDNTYALYMEQRYSFELRQASLLRDGETPDGYVARMLELYPEKSQQAYIGALHAVMPLAISGPYALQELAEGQEVDPKIANVYPPELNGHIIGKGLEDKTLWRLKANPTQVAEAIGACNLGEYAVRNFGDRQVKEVRQQIEAVVLGKAKIEGASIPTELKVGVNQLALTMAEKIVGVELVEQIVRGEVEKLVTTRSLQLSTDSTADAFGEVSKYLGEYFDPLSLLATSLFSVQLSLDNLKIHPDVGKGIIDAHERAVKPRIVQSEN